MKFMEIVPSSVYQESSVFLNLFQYFVQAMGPSSTLIRKITQVQIDVGIQMDSV